MKQTLPEGMNYCRKCSFLLPTKNFYEHTDNGFVDSNGLQSVCKNCIQDMYSEIYNEKQSMEKAIHKLCTSLNIKYSNEAVSATKANINTLLENGKNVNFVFGIYKSKLVATNPSMDKSANIDLTYDDVGTIYTSEQQNIKEIPIPQDVIDFWGKDLGRSDIEFLEREYANFKQTHKADTYAEIVLLKEVCNTMLTIKNLRATNDDTQKEVKQLQELMKNLNISPNATIASASGKGADSFGLWIQDIEREEPAQWLKTDPRGDMFRDVGNVEEYFQKYFVRPLKNFITGSKDFNVEDEQENEDYMYDEEELNSLNIFKDEE